MKEHRSKQSLKTIVGYALVRITLTATALSMAVLLFSQVLVKQADARETAHNRFIQIEHMISENEIELQTMQSDMGNLYLTIAESAAYIIQKDKSILESSEELQVLAEALHLGGISIFDETGTLIAASNPDYVGMTLDDGEQMQFFKPMLQDKSLRLAQPVQPRTLDGALYQYSAVWLPDGSCIVQVGRSGDNAAKHLANYNLSEIFNVLVIDTGAKLLAINEETDLIDGSTNKEDLGKTAEAIGLNSERIHDGAAFHATVNGKFAYCVFTELDNHYIGRIVPVAEVYFGIFPSAVWTAIILLFSASLMIWGIRKKMHQFVLNHLRGINGKLSRIAAGSLEEQFDAESSIEFSELSHYLNTMVASLRQRMNERERVFRILSQHSNRALFRYQMADGSITPLDANRTEEHALYPLYRLGYSDDILADSPRVEESSKAPINRFFDAIHSGESAGEIEVQFLPDEKNCRWYHLKFSSILEQGKPVLTLLSAEDTTARHEREQQLLTKSSCDTMTGLLRRGYGEEQIRERLVKPHDCGGVLMILDLDDLKGINDTFGHRAGDHAIIGIATALKSHFRKDDILVRAGGDEFIIFLSGAADNTEAVELSLASLLLRLSSTVIEDANGRTIHCSVGCAVERLGEDDFDSLYRRADMALYQVKRNGKSNFAFYAPGMEEKDFAFRTNLLSLPTKDTSSVGEVRHLLRSLAGFYDLVLSVNLSRNSYYLMEEVKDGVFTALPSSGALTDFLQAAAIPVHPKDLADFHQHLRYEALLEAHSAGKRSINRNFRYCIGDTVRWVECIVIFYTGEQGDACEYSLIRWADDKASELDRLQHQLDHDISERQEELAELKQRYSMEDTLFRCLNLLTDGSAPDAAISSLLETIGGYYESDRVYILEFDVAHQAVRYSYEWCAPGISPERDSLQNLPLSALELWLKKFEQEDAFFLRDLSAASESSAYAHQLLCAQGVTGIQAAPLRRGGELIGLVGVDNPHSNEAQLVLLKTVSGLITETLDKLRLSRDLEQLNSTDSLTGVYNRRHFAQLMEQLTVAPPTSLGIITLDVNGLKDINETYGHDFGDRILRRVARVLSVHHSATAHRIGGDEFAVLCGECSRETFQEQVLALRAALDATEGCEVSMGFAWSSEQTEVIPSQLQQQADEMRQAEKHAYYLTLLSEGRTIKRSGLGGEVISEIEGGCFEVYYQPQIDLRNHRVIGAEALVRKRAKDGSIILPGKFLPLYEVGGVISYIDLFVLKESCTALRSWLDAGHDLHLSVNFSRTTLIKSDIVDIMAKICADAQVPTSRIYVEVTETLSKLDSVSLKELGEKLLQAGFKISLDDFGSEYSNLAILTAMDFDEVKLDRSLVSSMESNEKGCLVLESVLGLCRGLAGTKSLAEGIETQEQMERLRSFSCDYGQGYLFSRPISRDAFDQYLQEKSKTE